MKNLLGLFAIILFTFTMHSCRDKCKDSFWYRCQTAQLLRKYSFQPGSYWIYQDSINGDIDSVIVTNLTVKNHAEAGTGYLDGGKPCSEYVDMIYMDMTSYVNGSYHCRRHTFGECDFFEQSDSAFGKKITEGFGFGSPDTIHNFTTGTFFFTTVFRNKYVDSTSYYRDNLILDVYFADNIGIVKKVVSDSSNYQNWSLLRYHLIQ